MIDFLRANTWCSQEQYLWKMTVAQVQLSAVDFSHIKYNTKKDSNTHKIGSADDLKNLNDLGLPII